MTNPTCTQNPVYVAFGSKNFKWKPFRSAVQVLVCPTEVIGRVFSQAPGFGHGFPDGRSYYDGDDGWCCKDGECKVSHNALDAKWRETVSAIRQNVIAKSLR